MTKALEGALLIAIAAVVCGKARGSFQARSIWTAVRVRRNSKDAANTELQIKARAWCNDPEAARQKYGSIEDWDVSDITSFKKLFYTCHLFNADLSAWKTSNVVDMSWMFGGATAFNSNLASWDVSNVENMGSMFRFAYAFSSNLESWDVSKVEDMAYMFNTVHALSSDLGRWRFKYPPPDMSQMFAGSKSNCTFESPGRYDQSHDRTPTARLYCNGPSMLKDGAKCTANNQCDTGSCSTNQRCFGYAAADANCSIASNSGGCFVAPTTAPSWSSLSTALSAADLLNHFPSQMVGNGTESTVIQWHPLLENGQPRFNSTDILIKGDGSPLDTTLTYKLKWLAQSADPTLFKVGQQPPSSNASVWDSNNGPGGVGIDCSSGDIFATPTTTGKYTAWLIAVDTAGLAKKSGLSSEFDEVMIKQWDLTVTDVSIFTVTSFERGLGVVLGNGVKINTATQTASPTPKNCAFNEECSIERVRLSSLTPEPTGKITYTVQVENDAGFFTNRYCDFALLINPDTGYMAGKYVYNATNTTRNQSTTCTAFLSAVETIEELPPQTARLEAFKITFRPADTALAVNGPHEKKCEHGRQFDGVKFDQIYSCNCDDTIYTGDNCEIAKDAKACPAEDQTLVVGECKTFVLGIAPRSKVDGYTNPKDTASYTVGNTYRMAPFTVLPSTTTSRGNISDITFQLGGKHADAAPFFVKSGTGEFVASFTEGDADKTYSFELVARDAGGAQVVVDTYTMHVVQPDTFKVQSFERMDAADGVQYFEPNTAATFKECAYNEECSVGSIIKDSLAPRPNGKIAYTVHVDRQDGCELMLLIDPDTGYMSGKYPAAIPTRDQSITCTATLSAVQTLGELPPQTGELETFAITFRHKDTLFPEYGPNNRGCDHQGQPEDLDETPFNRVYACKCSAGYTGDNCETQKSTAGMAALAICLGIAAISTVTYMYRTRQLRLKAHDFQSQLGEMRANGELPANIASSNIPREIKRSHVIMTNKIGHGGFGDVWKGVLDESAVGGAPGYLVAVKTTKSTDSDGTTELLHEASLMALVEHHQNIVSIIGVVTSGTPLLLLITFCEHGALDSCLKGRLLPHTKTKLSVCLDVARGMDHLATNAFVHRDLAARNVLLDSVWTGKVADFGLSRLTAISESDAADGAELYYKSGKGTFAVRWTAPDMMETMRSSTATDVWAFGVTMFEVYADGAKPYSGMDNAAVINRVQSGYRLPKPSGCSDGLYRVMARCWDAIPSGRPSFAELADVLAEEIRKETSAIPDEIELKASQSSHVAADALHPINENVYAERVGMPSSDADDTTRYVSMFDESAADPHFAPNGHTQGGGDDTSDGDGDGDGDGSSAPPSTEYRVAVARNQDYTSPLPPPTPRQRGAPTSSSVPRGDANGVDAEPIDAANESVYTLRSGMPVRRLSSESTTDFGSKIMASSLRYGANDDGTNTYATMLNESAADPHVAPKGYTRGPRGDANGKNQGGTDGADYTESNALYASDAAAAAGASGVMHEAIRPVRPATAAAGGASATLFESSFGVSQLQVRDGLARRKSPIATGLTVLSGANPKKAGKAKKSKNKVGRRGFAADHDMVPMLDGTTDDVFEI